MRIAGTRAGVGVGRLNTEDNLTAFHGEDLVPEHLSEIGLLFVIDACTLQFGISSLAFRVHCSCDRCTDESSFNQLYMQRLCNYDLS